MKSKVRRVVAAARKHHIALIEIVRKNQGIHFRELLNVSGLAVGTLQHRLELLENFGLLKAYRSAYFTRYYTPDLSKKDLELLVQLR